MAANSYDLYFNAYADAQQRYSNAVQAGPAWEGYVVLNGGRPVGAQGGLQTAWQAAEGNKAWGAYVDYHPDLTANWNSLTPAQKATYNDPGTTTGGKGNFGQNHYNTFGSREGRVVPYFFEGNTPGTQTVTSRSEWGQVHYNKYGAAEGRRYPYNYDPNNRLGGQGIDLFFDAGDFAGIDWAKVGQPQNRILPTYTGDPTQDSYNVLAVTNPQSVIGKANAPQSGAYSTTDVLIPPKIGYDTTSGQLFFSSPGDNFALRSKYQNAINAFNTSTGGNYKQLINQIAGGTAMSAAEKAEFFSAAKPAIDSFYLSKKVGAPWDPNISGAQPPAGGFDPVYYEQNYPDALTGWNQANAENLDGYGYQDLDITGRYTKNTYLQQYYTNVGKGLNQRANAAIDPAQATTYKESLTDADYQLYRDQVLGLATPTQPTILETKLQTVLTQKDLQEQQVFGALTQDVLKESIAELKKAKQKENTLSLVRGLPGYEEIYSINSTIANSLLGDSGVGGLLSLNRNTTTTQESLEKQLQGVTGINTSNSAVYNWQQWFDTVLVKKYETGLTVADPTDATKQYQVDQAFATNFITNYLKPRFDTSRSMDEFVSYIDVQQKEQNVFQTQSALDSLRQVADLRAKSYLDSIRTSAPVSFNADFYFAPTGTSVKSGIYTQQASEVAADWEAAKAGDPFWATEAYRYGIDINDKAAFAKLHYQVKGLGKGYDPAPDVISFESAQNYIDSTILPAVQAEKLAIGDASFLQFVTPEEFADKLLQGVSPAENKAEWQKLLDQFGLSDTGQTVDELRNYIIDALRTGAAKDIRESIKYLNEKKLVPTQERLGVSYIQRPEDVKTSVSPNQTQLYKVFQTAGYKGTEDEFYETFLPDVDRNEQVALTKAATGVGFTAGAINTSDPFATLVSLEDFFAKPQAAPTSAQEKVTARPSTSSSYFKLFDETTDPALQKSKTGQQILGEFTSLFKGFT